MNASIKGAARIAAEVTAAATPRSAADHGGLAPPDPALASLALAQWPGEVALLDTGLRVQWINDRFAERLGLPAAKCIGLEWLALHPTAAVHAAAYERACRGEGIELPAFPAHGPARLGLYATSLQPLSHAGGVAGLLVTESDVTDALSKSALESRREALLRAVSEGSRDIVTLLDADGRILFVGDPVVVLTGRKATELVGRNIFEFIHPDDLEEVRAKMDSGDVVRTPLRVRRVRYRFRHGDGGWRWFESLAVNALHDPLLATIIVHSRDVSEEVELDLALRRRERRFRTLTEKSDDLIVVLGADGKTMFESASIGRILGFRPRELTARRMLRLLHPAHRRPAIAVAREMIDHAGYERRIEFMVRDASGGYRWIEATLVDLVEDPDVAGLLINARDVTSRKVAEVERDSALETAAVFVWEHDLATGRTRWLNEPSGLERLGMVGRARTWSGWLNRVHPDDIARVRQAYAALECGAASTFNLEFRVQADDGHWQRIMFRGRVVSPAVTGCRLVRGVCIDVTERRRIEDELARSREQFRVALECAQIGFYEWDLESDTLTGLDEWCAAHGVPPESGRPGHDARWESLVHPDDAEALRLTFAEHIDGASQYAEVEYRLRTADGRWIWVFDRAQVTRRAADGRALAVAGICMEIDRRRRAELALRETETRLAATVWGAGIGMWEMDTNGAGARWFNDWCETEDLHPCEGPDHVATWDAHIHPEDLPRAAALFSDLMDGRRDVYESEYRIRTRAGRWIWIFERSRATERGADGRPRRIVGICMNVQARKQAEQALRKSEFLYRTVAEFTSGYVCEFSVDEDGRFEVAWASDGFAAVYGVAPQDFTRHGWGTFLLPEERPAARERAQRLCRGEQVSAEIEIRRLDGARRWLQVTTRPIVDPLTGRTQAAIGHAHDITERKLAERALHDSQQQLRSIAENSTDWLLQVDRDRRIVFSNRSLNGIPPERLCGRPVEEFASPEDGAKLRDFVSAALAGQLPATQLEQVVTDMAGSARVLLVRAKPVPAADAIAGVVLTVTEITRQRRDERMLQLQARILETMREGVVLIDSRNAVRLTNPAFDELFGYRHGELVGRQVEQLFRLDEAARRVADRRLRAQLAGHRGEPLEFDCVRQDGTSFAAACVVTPLLIDGADHLLAVLNDVTERKVLERQILEVSNREQQRIGNDLHDGLGQELTGVALMLRSLSTRVRRAHPDALPEIDEIVALLNQSIHNARTLARGLSPVSLERGGLVPALRTLAVRARETYGLSLTLRTRVTRPLRLDEGAASHLYRIVQEALSNAMRHGRASRVRIQLSADDLAIRLSVHDNGPGLPPDAQRSAGLGLRTMRYRAQVIGGDLLVTNHRLGGTIVRCVCPQGAREGVSLSHAHARAHARAHAPMLLRSFASAGRDPGSSGGTGGAD